MERKKASPPAPLQGERGGSKLRGCDSQDRAIQTISVISVKSVGIKIKADYRFIPRMFSIEMVEHSWDSWD